MNPFDWSGPVFLQAYIALATLAIVVALAWRHRLQSRRAGERSPELHPYEVAHLAGGAARTVDTALASLIEGGHVEYDESKYFHRREDLERSAHPLERALMGALSAPALISDLRRAAAPEVGNIRERLERLRLEMTDSEVMNMRVLPLLPILLVLCFGLIKLVIGVERHKPVGILIAGSIILGMLCVILVSTGPRLTSLGSSLLEQIRARHAALQVTANNAPAALVGPDLTMAVCLFGPMVLMGGPYVGMQSFMHGNVVPGGSTYGNSCGSSCGSSGSSCGGGGGSGCGGGGGCGGCGGGD